jgi:hypothetical protein
MNFRVIANRPVSDFTVSPASPTHGENKGGAK